MKLRDYAALTTGALTFTAAVIAQWIWTKRPIEDVVFIAVMAAFIGVAVFAGATEHRHPKRRKHRARPVDRQEQPVFITLNRREWNDGKKKDIGIMG